MFPTWGITSVALVQLLQQARRDLDLMTRLDKHRPIITANHPFSAWRVQLNRNPVTLNRRG